MAWGRVIAFDEGECFPIVSFYEISPMMPRGCRSRCHAISSLRSWRYSRRARNKVLAGRAARSERRSNEKYRLPENLGILNAAHFYHLNIEVKAIVLNFVLASCMADNGEFEKGDTPTKPVKGRKTQEENANDFCRLCGVNLKIKFGNFQKSSKYISTENLFKPSGHAKRGGTTLAELCSEIGLNIVESRVLSSRVCQSCGRKIFNAVELVRFIRSGLEGSVEVPICSSDTQDTQVRIKRLLPSSASSPDRSPQAKKNLYKGRSTPKKSLNFSESTSSNATNKENMPLDVNQETITLRVSHFAAELNVESLCGKQTTQLKVLIVNPNGRIDSHCSFDDETKSIILNACRKT